MEIKAWGGRFEEETDKFFEEFSESISFDYKLAPYEIKASLVYAKALKQAEILTLEEYEKICQGLKEIEREILEGSFKFDKVYEDVHMNIERALFDKIGEIAYKLHTGRSRNEQVVTDLRLYLVDETFELKNLLLELMQKIILKAEENLEVVIPGFTHLQHAQPVLYSHWLLAYYEMFSLHFQRLLDYEKRLKICPLGSSALAGCGFPLNREEISQALGFLTPSRNSVFAISSRDFILELTFILTLIMLDISRMGEEIVIWMSPEFRFIELPDRFCTGSSIMPQKKNPDSAELLRGKCATVIGNLVQLLTLIKNLPLSYNRDLQEDKPPLFQALDTTQKSLKMLSLLVQGLKLNKERLKEILKEGHLLATELADYLVTKGVPFRKAHHICGQIVLYAEKLKKRLFELSLDEFKNFSPLIEEDVYQWLTLEHALQRREILGGTGLNSVKGEIKRAKEEVKRWKNQLS
ncbi:MAG: argininosuccinate lyase [Thermodesulfobacteriaceae bacterium]|nr:argininosuccinate lyase [Thermodesulfobacteriaceae bacterium]MCX8041923.1 argininosuccinate lyase [Thermodesulfobacteriaceae bacterium]MDW8136365.1 argininosuccinate lyase [Thermodesulfobacterium sp.]